MSVLAAAAMDREVVPWRVTGATSGAAAYGAVDVIDAAVALMERCLDSDPTSRPSLNDVQTALRALL